MNVRIGSGGGQDRDNARGLQDEKDSKSFEAAAAKKPAVIKESFITSVMAARQPPRLPLDEMVPEKPDAGSVLYAQEISNLARMSDADIVGNLADIYITHAQEAQSLGSPQLSEAFDYLGELMTNYEHLRLLRTGEMG